MLSEVAGAYAEALERERDPRRQVELRVRLGQTLLENDQPEEALRQASLVLDQEKNRPEALLLWARAMTESGATSSEKASRRREAVDRLEQVIKGNPSFVEGYHTLAEIHLRHERGSAAIDGSKGDRTAAIAVLRADLQANPDDGVAAGQLVQFLAERPSAGQAPAAADLAEARRIAADVSRRDTNGRMILAIAIGFHRAGQLELALPLAQAAAEKLDSPAAHLNFGDLLLAIAESQSDSAIARETFERAVQQYVLVLKVQPNSVEAANNKAWILHTYLDRSQEALELVMDLKKHVAPTALPGEFFDTLGSIQESIGQTLDAEQSYLDGLKKSPENPALNFHIGRLLAADHSRATKAKAHLNKALLARERISPTMAHEAESLVRNLSGGVRAN